MAEEPILCRQTAAPGQIRVPFGVRPLLSVGVGSLQAVFAAGKAVAPAGRPDQQFCNIFNIDKHFKRQNTEITSAGQAHLTTLRLFIIQLNIILRYSRLSDGDGLMYHRKGYTRWPLQ